MDESWYIKPTGVKESITAGGVVARLLNGQVWVALVQEGDQMDYILPKGSLEAGEDLESAARREIEEEAGLTSLELVASLGVQERLNYRRTAWKITHYFLFITQQEEGHPTDITHGYRCRWFPIDSLPGMFWPEQKRLIEDNRDRIVTLVGGRTV
jgi:8-oxo-dGTP pyrophosphatase MutT (NUDIX family)